MATPPGVSWRTARRSFAGRWAVLALLWSGGLVLVAGWILTMIDPQYASTPVVVRCVFSVFGALLGLVVAVPVVLLVAIAAGAFGWATWNDRFRAQAVAASPRNADRSER